MTDLKLILPPFLIGAAPPYKNMVEASKDLMESETFSE